MWEIYSVFSDLCGEYFFHACTEIYKQTTTFLNEPRCRLKRQIFSSSMGIIASIHVPVSSSRSRTGQNDLLKAGSCLIWVNLLLNWTSGITLYWALKQVVALYRWPLAQIRPYTILKHEWVGGCKGQKWLHKFSRRKRTQKVWAFALNVNCKAWIHALSL